LFIASINPEVTARDYLASNDPAPIIKSDRLLASHYSGWMLGIVIDSHTFAPLGACFLDKSLHQKSFGVNAAGEVSLALLPLAWLIPYVPYPALGTWLTNAGCSLAANDYNWLLQEIGIP
jgi:hypothetical protein